mmetsp:Transcript_9928/g.15953  ORF Transcript_9928/g.15953 Transcript_9928/m.15953 type:complete len:292 (-) Transcript_9928:386-1261(-)|eukprot:CAMPEP_0196131434 /NCGR_PEP_ID=MMETSP0910-20130528/1448_1 /TAXON_ID=49265 /ORGANISM="Thalassiosira rotula, Strain GSO102" /LENGTH=291 /DNA_ID=CAMNT_0041390903 /DNA_START=175 /DNA_END=1050 /DNA_ORIENTATION=+
MTALTEFNRIYASSPNKLRRSDSYGCCSEDDSVSNNGIPELIMAASLQSHSETDSDSLASSVRSSSSQRSIFGSYWLSPAHTQSAETNDEDEDELGSRLQTLKTSPMNTADELVKEDSSSSNAAANKTVQAPITKRSSEAKKSHDDNSVDYRAALGTAKNPTRTARRQILPTPPPPTAISSSLLQPRLQRHLLLSPLGGEKKSFSTSILLKRPHQSCLRKSRYLSCSIIEGGVGRLHLGLRNNGYPNLHHHRNEVDELKKSVSFFSQVSVVEFAVPKFERSSQKGWDKQFA